MMMLPTAGSNSFFRTKVNVFVFVCLMSGLKVVVNYFDME